MLTTDETNWIAHKCYEKWKQTHDSTFVETFMECRMYDNSIIIPWKFLSKKNAKAELDQVVEFMKVLHYDDTRTRRF